MKKTFATLLAGAAMATLLFSPVAAHDLTANGGCREGDFPIGVAVGDTVDRNGDLAACRTANGRIYDNHLHAGGGGGGGGWTDFGCREGDTLIGVLPGHEADRNEDLAACETSRGRTYDNRLPNDGGGGGGGWTDFGCRQGDALVFVLPGHEADTDGDLAVCQTDSGRFYDNR